MGRYFPFNYDMINLAAGEYSPSSVKSFNNKTFWFWSRALFERLTSVFIFDLPENWQGSKKDFFLWCLFRFGYVAISKNSEFGFFFQPCTLNKMDFYYQPKFAQISNPLYHAELEIGKECELLKLSPDFFGAFDVVEYYAEKLATLDNAINMSLINGKFAFMIGAKNKQAGNALKKMLDLVNDGEPAAILDMSIPNDPKDKESPFQQLQFGKPKENYLTTEQLNDFRTIMNNFDSEIGIPADVPFKKERLVASEADSRKVDARARSIVWYETLLSSLDACRALYPEAKDIRVKMRYDIEEGDPDAEVRDDGTR